MAARSCTPAGDFICSIKHLTHTRNLLILAVPSQWPKGCPGIFPGPCFELYPVQQGMVACLAEAVGTADAAGRERSHTAGAWGQRAGDREGNGCRTGRGQEGSRRCGAGLAPCAVPGRGTALGGGEGGQGNGGNPGCKCRARGRSWSRLAPGEAPRHSGGTRSSFGGVLVTEEVCLAALGLWDKQGTPARGAAEGVDVPNLQAGAEPALPSQPGLPRPAPPVSAGSALSGCDIHPDEEGAPPRTGGPPEPPAPPAEPPAVPRPGSPCPGRGPTPVPPHLPTGTAPQQRRAGPGPGRASTGAAAAWCRRPRLPGGRGAAPSPATAAATLPAPAPAAPRSAPRALPAVPPPHPARRCSALPPARLGTAGSAPSGAAQHGTVR